MDVSRRSRRADAASADRAIEIVRDRVASVIAHHVPNGGRVAVALSGGRDSMVLLDAAVVVCAGAAALVAIHVHHGLARDADHWATFCANECAKRGVPFWTTELRIAAKPEDGIEAAARTLRYRALAKAARVAQTSFVLLAHHQDDQAETLLLQLARGAGPHGLGAMAVARERDGITWLRPLLDLPRATIDTYVQARGLSHVDDASNNDPRFRRNAVRHMLAPALAAIFPGYPATFARAASLQAEAARLADDLAALDAKGAVRSVALDRRRLTELPGQRARNLLRWFLRERGLRPPSAARLADMLRQLTTAAADAKVRIAHDGAEIGVFRGEIVVHRSAPAPFAMPWNGERVLELPHGRLDFVPVDGEGLALRILAGRSLVVRSREGGERFAIGVSGMKRTLKHLLRETGIPPWQRVGLPLVYCDGLLAAVPGIGVAHGFRAGPGCAGLRLEWRDNATDGAQPAASPS